MEGPLQMYSHRFSSRRCAASSQVAPQVLILAVQLPSLVAFSGGENHNASLTSQSQTETGNTASKRQQLVVLAVAISALLVLASVLSVVAVKLFKKRYLRRVGLYNAAITLAKHRTAKLAQERQKEQASINYANRNAVVQVSNVTLSAGAMEELEIADKGGSASEHPHIGFLRGPGGKKGRFDDRGWPDVNGMWRACSRSGDSEQDEEQRDHRHSQSHHSKQKHEVRHRSQHD